MSQFNVSPAQLNVRPAQLNVRPAQLNARPAQFNVLPLTQFNVILSNLMVDSQFNAIPLHNLM